MFQIALERITHKKTVLQTLIFFTVFMVIYTMIDSNNLSYTMMADQFGMYLVILNILLNVLMASLSALLLSLSTIMAQLKGKESMSSNLSFVSVLLGVLTYGCTP